MSRLWWPALHHHDRGLERSARNPLLLVLAVRHALELYSRDLIYEANAGRIGLLGTNHARAVAYSYQKIAAFRQGLNVLVDYWNAMDNEERLARLNSLLVILDEAAQKGAETISGLEDYASSGNLRGWLRTFALYQVVATRFQARRQKPPTAH